MTTTTSRESDSPSPAERVRWTGDLGPPARRAPTRGTEAVGAAFRAQVALRAPGVVMVPAPVTEADANPDDLSDPLAADSTQAPPAEAQATQATPGTPAAS